MKRVIAFETDKYMNEEHIKEVVYLAKNLAFKCGREIIVKCGIEARYELLITDYKLVVKDIHFYTPEERAEVWGKMVEGNNYDI